jgi:hypothetical protein
LPRRRPCIIAESDILDGRDDTRKAQRHLQRESLPGAGIRFLKSAGRTLRIPPSPPAFARLRRATARGRRPALAQAGHGWSRRSGTRRRPTLSATIESTIDGDSAILRAITGNAALSPVTAESLPVPSAGLRSPPSG